MCMCVYNLYSKYMIFNATNRKKKKKKIIYLFLSFFKPIRRWEYFP